MKAHEIYSAISQDLVDDMLSWFRQQDRKVYKTAIATLAGQRKLRPVFIEKKSLKDQYAWVYKTLQIKACNEIGEHMLQAWLMGGHQDMLSAFCDAIDIKHDGKGSVTGNLPKTIDTAKLDAAVDQLVEKFDARMVTIYLQCFNLQVTGGWPELTAKLESDERLKLA